MKDVLHNAGRTHEAQWWKGVKTVTWLLQRGSKRATSHRFSLCFFHFDACFYFLKQTKHRLTTYLLILELFYYISNISWLFKKKKMLSRAAPSFVKSNPTIFTSPNTLRIVFSEWSWPWGPSSRLYLPIVKITNLAAGPHRYSCILGSSGMTYL